MTRARHDLCYHCIGTLVCWAKTASFKCFMSAHVTFARTRRAGITSSGTLNQDGSGFPRSTHEERTGFEGNSGSNQVGGIVRAM